MKKYFILTLCIVLAAVCMFACGKDKTDDSAKATDVPQAATEEPTEAPTEEPTEAPTEAPTEEPTKDPSATEKPTKMNVDGIVTDMSDEIPVSGFTMVSGANFDYVDGFYYTSITNESETEDAAVSFRLWDPRYIDEGTGIVADDADDRTLADPAVHPFYAIKYRVTGEATTQRSYSVGSWEGNVLTAPSDVIPYENHALICDNEWHTVIIDLAAECPTLCAQCVGGADALDCVIFSAPADGDSTIDIAWYGAFKSVEEINAWDENFCALYGEEVTISK